jgi:hypothetical protein
MAKTETPPVCGPDISEDEARAILCDRLGCRPHDIEIQHFWRIIAPNPKVEESESPHTTGGWLREQAELLKQTVARMVMSGTGKAL